MRRLLLAFMTGLFLCVTAFGQTSVWTPAELAVLSKARMPPGHAVTDGLSLDEIRAIKRVVADASLSETLKLGKVKELLMDSFARQIDETFQK